MAVIDLRGTNGSGKSWLMHKLLETYPHEPIHDSQTTKRTKIKGYCLRIKSPGYHDTVLLGNYERNCGGVDSWPHTTVTQMVREYSVAYKLVLLEGVMVSHTLERYHQLACDLPDYSFLFLNTPVMNCIGRVRARQYAKYGHVKEYDPKWLRYDHYRINGRIKRRLTEMGHRIVTVPWKTPWPVFHDEVEAGIDGGIDNVPF